MSDIVTIKTEVRDPAAIQAACQRLKLAPPVQGNARLFTSEAAGMIVQLPDWQYPVVCDTASGQVQFDNFGGRWGDLAQMDRFLQTYAVEKAKIEARRRGHSVTEEYLPDGSIKLTLQVAGGTA